MPRPRVIVAARDSAERGTLAEWLITEGYEPVLVGDPLAATTEIAGRPSLAFVVDYALTERADLHGSWRARRPQTPPVVIGDVDPAAQARTEGLSAIYVERPIERVTLLCMVLMAILEGRPERRSPRKASSVFASLNGRPSRIVDLSAEGLRLELPREIRLPPAIFKLTLPTAGVTVNVRRMWTASPENGDKGTVWCGGALADNPARVAQAWLGLVRAT